MKELEKEYHEKIKKCFEDCEGIRRRCGFTKTKKSEKSWRVARRMQIKETDQAAHLPVYIHLCEAQAVERSIRSETAKSHRKQRGINRRREKRRKKRA